VASGVALRSCHRGLLGKSSSIFRGSVAEHRWMLRKG
jgi:hypothetical protein